VTELAIDDLTADLDLLDDETCHAFCDTCYPVRQLGVPFIAYCGCKAIGFVGESAEPPDNACPDCLAVWKQPCRRCGS
jgi:hypothetical protein